MLVRHRMTPNPITIGPHAMLSEAHEKMTTGRFRRLPVMDTGALVGILTDRDILRHWGSETRTKVQAALTETPLTIPPDMPVEEATQLLLRDQIGGLPVVDNGKLIGIVTTSDILAAFLEVTGASTPGSIRINLLLQDNEHLVDVTQIIHAVNCEILAMGTYEEPVSHRRAYFLRIAGADATKATVALQQKGYSLL